MIKVILWTTLFMFISCGGSQIATKRNQMWSNHFTFEQQKEFLYQAAEERFEKGKRELNIQDLIKSQEAFRFLAVEYVYDKADAKVKEVDQFIHEHTEYYRELFSESKQKNLMFTAAGYAKQILRLKPDDISASNYLEENKEAIEKRMENNISSGFKYMSQNQLNAAQRCFNRVLVFDPDHAKSQSALQTIKRKKQENRLATIKKNQKKERDVKKAVEDEQKALALSAKEKEDMYSLGIKAYQEKDYIKAFNVFENLVEYTYKDSLLYFKRSEDKINVLGLKDE